MMEIDYTKALGELGVVRVRRERLLHWHWRKDVLRGVGEGDPRVNVLEGCTWTRRMALRAGEQAE